MKARISLAAILRDARNAALLRMRAENAGTLYTTHPTAIAITLTAIAAVESQPSQ